jgi:hypothetical protein
MQAGLGKMMSNDESEPAPAGHGSPPAKQAGPGKQDWIGAHLRQVYDEALNEPVPDRLLALLKKIDQKERRS